MVACTAAQSSPCRERRKDNECPFFLLDAESKEKKTWFPRAHGRYVKTNTAFCENGCDLLISILHCKINLREFSCISYGLDKRTTWLVRVRERLLSWLPVLLVSRKQRAPSNSIMHFVYMYSLHPPSEKTTTYF